VEGPLIQLENVDIFQGDHLVLHQVNITLTRGEMAYLIGKTGSGKSSLLKTLYGELKPQSGEGKVASFQLDKLKKKQVPFLRRKLGIVFQDFQLLSDRNVLDNLIFVLKATGWKDKAQMKKRAHEVLKKVELETKDYKMPHELSGGEQQRVSIARALLNDPEIILADEPTGNLDPTVTRSIMTLLTDICKEGTAVLMATHDHNLITEYPGKVYHVSSNKVEIFN
jgi:cell division transport system ATP-binding protein